MELNYKNYFKDHYKSSFSNHDVDLYRKWFYRQWHFMLKKINITNKDVILEIGSGIGGFYSFLSPINCREFIGLELDQTATNFSNKYFNTRKFINKSIEDYSSKNKFDKIFAFEVLEHFYDPIVNINKIFKLLKKDGVFCGTTPYPFYKNIIADETHLFVLHPNNWERLFKNAGFSSVKLYPMSFIPFIWRLNKHFNIRLPFYFPFNYFISTCLIIATK